MPISDATIKAVKFSPELLPDSRFGNVPLGAEIAPAVLDLRRFSPFIAELQRIQVPVPAGAGVNLRATYDNRNLEENTQSMIVDNIAGPLVGTWRLPSKNRLYYNWFGAAAVPAFTGHFSVWAYKPTVAHKILWDIQMTPEERAIADKYGIASMVEKGILPYKPETLIDREYIVTGEETHSRVVNIAVAATTYLIENLYALPGEIIVLTSIAAAPGTAAQNIQIVIDRDSDGSYITMPTFPLSLVLGGEVQCFIPAIKEISISTIATVAPPPELVRYTFKRIKLSKILQIRFGLVQPSDVSQELYQEVMGGIL